MNFKFWTGRRRTDEASRERRPTAYFRTPVILTDAEQKRRDLERLLALANIPDTNPVWKTLLSYADEHARNEQESALLPDLPDSVRQYNAGRAAGALDFATALRELRALANAEARKIENKQEK